MPTIAVLPDELASQIAAGEVVERPSSALKELLENAMDAGATRVGIEIEGGGITRLSVLDDGCGMSEEDAVLSLARHATSKLRRFEDLTLLSSYGFRGEALPSIASVSRLSIRTRRSDTPSGVELSVEGGLKPTLRPAGCAPGTLVEVRDLFFNVPARRKFLRSSGTEAGHITEVVESLALANPRLALTLKRDGRLIRQWLRVADRRERAALALDEEFAECRGERGPLGVEAYVTRPERARTGAGGLRILVNGRPIRDRALAVAVAQAYGSVLERGRYPRGVIYLDLPLELVDFNVHPQKLEIRFADPRAVSDALYQVLASQLGRGFSSPAPFARAAERPAEPATALESEPPPSELRAAHEARTSSALDVPAETGGSPLPLRVESPRAGWSRAHASGATARAPIADGVAAFVYRHGEVGASEPIVGRSPAPVPLVHAPGSSAPAFESEPTESAEFAAPERADERTSASGQHVEWAALEFVAQVRQMFLICEGPGGLFIIDQHAAAERVTFDRIRRQYQARNVTSQALLFPVEVQLSPEEAEFLEAHAGEFAALGMDLRLRGTQWVSVHGVPRLLERVSPERLLRDLLAETMRQGGRGFSGAVDLALATLACHASLRSGDPVSPAEARALLEALDGADFAGHCPHGRPIVSFTPWGELLRKVGRR
ncbi:MAG TPA: DNA mismatch repair endonuclease MutL [Polyangiaceae bacterium]|nr:DNA mismatch repair endonuclease MutL [Polyangiaceae bacterium]